MVTKVLTGPAGVPRSCQRPRAGDRGCRASALAQASPNSSRALGAARPTWWRAISASAWRPPASSRPVGGADRRQARRDRWSSRLRPIARQHPVEQRGRPRRRHQAAARSATACRSAPSAPRRDRRPARRARSRARRRAAMSVASQPVLEGGERVGHRVAGGAATASAAGRGAAAPASGSASRAVPRRRSCRRPHPATMLRALAAQHRTSQSIPLQRSASRYQEVKL